MGVGGFGKRLDWEQVVAYDAILSVMKTPVGVAPSHDHRGKMPLPQKKLNFIGKPTSALRFINSNMSGLLIKHFRAFRS
jgi:hypothetical protein